MPSYHDEFPSKYLKAADITAPYDATFSELVKENVGTTDKPEHKLVAYFAEEGRKPVVCNKTRCEAVEEVTGTDNYAAWVGKRIHISKGNTRYNGKKTFCIAFSAPDIPF
jgi:hypothetical protein